MSHAPRMGASVFSDLLRRVDTAVTLDELRALRRFSERRLGNDERIAALDAAIERKATTMLADAEAAVRDAGLQESDRRPDAGA